MAQSNKLYRAKYGAWAGYPNGTKPGFTRCCESVTRYVGRWPQHAQCSNKRGHGPDQAYCKTHDPARVAARKEESDKRYRAKVDKWRFEAYGKSFYDVLVQIADGHNDARSLAKETISKFNGDD